MYNLCRRLSLAFAKRLPAQKPLCKRIVISVSALALGFNAPVFAKPPTQARIAVISQTGNSATNPISPPPIEAILANVRIKPVIQPKIAKLKIQRQRTTNITKLTRSQRPKIVARQSSRNRPSSAVTNLFNIDLVNSRDDNFTAVNRLIE